MARYVRSTYGKKKKTKSLFKKWLVVLLFLLVLIGAFAFALRLPSLTISSIEVTGVDGITEERIITLTKRELGGAYFLILPKNSIFAFPKTIIKRKVEKLDYSFTAVAIEKKDDNTLNIVIDSENAFARFCNTDDDCYLINAVSKVFARTEEVGDYPTFYSKNHVLIGENVTSEALFLQTRNFLERIGSLGVEFTDIYLDDLSYNSFFTTSGAEIRLDNYVQSEVAISNFESLIENEIITSDLSDIDYVDLRLETKAFVKRVQDEIIDQNQ